MRLQSAPDRFRIVGGGPWSLHHSPYRKEHLDPDSDYAVKLVEKYRLDEVIKGGNNEIEKFMLLKEWVCEQLIQHGWSFNLLKERPTNALDILSHANHGVRFQCNFYATVFVECCEALGYPARKIGILAHRIDTGFPIQRKDNIGHSVSEVWSNEYRKWMVVDCDYNVMYKKDGVFLSAAEMCLENLTNGGALIEPVFGRYKPTYDESGKGFIENRETIKYIMDTFGKNEAIDYYGTLSISDNLLLVDGKPISSTVWYIPPGLYPPLVINYVPVESNNHCTDQLSAINWSVNEVCIKASCYDPTKPSPPLRVELTHNMPNFDHAEMSANLGLDWKRTENDFIWDIHKGENKIWVRSVNKRRVRGPISSIHVLFD